MRKYQYYITGDDDDRDGYTANWMAQTFTVEVTHLIGKIKLKLFRVGDPGTITVSIKLTSAGKPIGGDLCSGTIEGTDLTLDTNGEWYEISLGDGFTLEKGVQYAIVVKAPDGAADKKVSWRADITDPTFTGGAYCSSSDSGIDWSIFSGVDCMFEEWGVGPPSATAVVWGNLPKSQISVEKIEEAILRMIQDHEDDPDSHLEEGESLYSHKASEIIDHIVNSIVADKIKDWEIIKLGGDFKRLDIAWTTYFESIDGYAQTGATVFEDEVQVAANNNTKYLFKELKFPSVTLSWNKDRRMKTVIRLDSITNQEPWIMMGTSFSGNKVQRHVGFKVENNHLYGTVANGTTESVLDCGLVSTGVDYLLEVEYEAGVGATFYVGGVNKGTILTNLPSGTIFANRVLAIYITSSEVADKKVRLSFWDFWQAS